MQNALNLVDLDDVALIEDVEAAFGIRFTDEEVSTCSTVGDIHGLLVKRLAPEEDRGGGCATSFGFYRLRAALQPMVELRLRPGTPINALDDIPVRNLYRLVEKSGLRPPHSVISGWGGASFLLFFAAPAAILFAGLPWWAALIAAIVAVGLFRISPLRLPGDIATVGDLARQVAHRSVGTLASQGARLGEREAWDALRHIVADNTVFLATEIGPETLLYAPRKRSTGTS